MKRVWIILASLVFAIASIQTVWAQVQRSVSVVGAEYRWPASLVGTSTNVVSILPVRDSVGMKILAGTFGSNVMETLDTGKTWTERGANLNLYLDLAGQIVLVDSNQMILGANDWICRSTDQGVSWFKSWYLRDNIGYIGSFLRTDNGTLFAVGDGILKSTDNGWTWTLIVDKIVAHYSYRSVQMPSGRIVVGLDGAADVVGSGKGIIISDDSGKTWTLSNSGLPTHKDIQSFAVVPNSSTIYAGIYDQGIYRSDDEGTSWSKVNSPDIVETLVFFSPNLGLLAGFGNGLYFSTDSGKTWTKVDQLDRRSICSMAQMDSTHMLIGTEDGMFIVEFSISGTTGVDNKPRVIPLGFALHQNYPNPFNPSTVIRYSVPKAGFVNISVYNLIGQEVKTLVNEGKRPGEYEVRFDGSNLPSGVYLYRIQTKGFTETKKMTLVK